MNKNAGSKGFEQKLIQMRNVFRRKKTKFFGRKNKSSA